MPDLELVLQRLIEYDVRFVLVGGYAAVVHGVTCFTQDTDVCCAFTPINLKRLYNAVRDLHPVHRMTPARLPFEQPQIRRAGLKNLYLSTDLGQLDCLGEIAGIGNYAAVTKCSVRFRLPFGICRVLTLDGLIRAKQAMDRPRDREVLLQLRAIREKDH